jgi:hypothetical protein
MQSLPRGTSSVKRRLKLVLPIVMGLISAVLMVWDIHNQNIIRLMAMRWDTGAPLWPYQTPDTLLYAMNLPAYYVGGASAYYFDVGLIGPLRYETFFPAILAWWWLAGRYLDKRSDGEKTTVRSPTWAVILCLFAILLIIVGITDSSRAFRWWWTYSREIVSVSDLILLRLIAPSLWCFGLSVVALLESKRRLSTGPIKTVAPSSPRIG